MKVAAASATSKRPPTAGLWLRLSARVPACVCVRALMHALSSRERERRAASGRASTRRELRFRSNRCALSAACVRSPRTCMRAHVRAPSHTRAFSLHSSSLHGKDNVAASFRTPWNDRVATVSVQRFLLPSFSLFFSSFFNLPPPPPPPPRFSSYIEASDSHSRETHPGRSWNTMNPDEIFLVFWLETFWPVVNRGFRRLRARSRRPWMAVTWMNIWIFSPTVQEAWSWVLIKKYFDSAISYACRRRRREIIYWNTANLNFRRIERCMRVRLSRRTCQKDCGNARPGKS